MFIYNITVKVENEILEKWMQWQKQIHIPEMIATGYFYDYRFYELLEHEEEDGKTFVIQFYASSKNDFDNYVEIGYEIHPSFQSRGFGTEAAKALIDFAFTKNISGIKAHTLREENNSVHILRKLGFTFQGEIELRGEGPLWYWLLPKQT